ncbi:vacuolar protein sorting-associated protein 32 homolog 1-like [Punica granatum]|uniref:Vacuolar protein sorting-associated protein 32 homolog 1-like n=2 Tax=Punica granatum TaxID=22663 RepID=A0A6P8DF58_PUNGR|nr:vacuolar protein sorting-associated protein 32 homolog 1-like [Punica granatum]
MKRSALEASLPMILLETTAKASANQRAYDLASEFPPIILNPNYILPNPRSGSPYHVSLANPVTGMATIEAAIQCLKRKILYEQQIEQLGNFQLCIHDQMIMLEGAKAKTETVNALRTGAATMKAMQKLLNIDDVDTTMDEINEQTENMKQIQEALSAPLGAAADFDEDELEAELEEHKGAELEEQLLRPVTMAPADPVHVPAGPRPVRPARKQTAEEDELAALQAEMAL